MKIACYNTPMVKRLKKLPFSVYEISAIDWTPGADVCQVTYAGVLDGVPHSIEVALSAMEAVCPTFERCLYCALVLTDPAEKEIRPAEIAQRIKCWASWFFRKDAQACMLFDLHGGATWNEIESIRGATRGKNKAASSNITLLTQGASRIVDSRILDANLPGFSVLQNLLVSSHRVPENLVLDLLGALAQKVSYRTLKTNPAFFIEKLNTCVPLGLSIEDLVQVLVDSVRQESASSLHLPELSSSAV
jgi:hypothetical protein